MPRKLRLGWQEGVGNRKGRWFGRHQGKRYYFPSGKGRSDREAFRAAMVAWTKKKAELDQGTDKPPSYLAEIDYRERLARLYLLDGKEEERKAIEMELAQLRRLVAMPSSPPFDTLGLEIDPLMV